ncbi:hypothetical protein G6F68_021713 [Rhizopus microsporus]|nr:hypothetical protein G6F68_021713 [Rhizopus microsporus]
MKELFTAGAGAFPDAAEFAAHLHQGRERLGLGDGRVHGGKLFRLEDVLVAVDGAAHLMQLVLRGQRS